MLIICILLGRRKELEAEKENFPPVKKRKQSARSPKKNQSRKSPKRKQSRKSPQKLKGGKENTPLVKTKKQRGKSPKQKKKSSLCTCSKKVHYESLSLQYENILTETFYRRRFLNTKIFPTTVMLIHMYFIKFLLYR